MARSNETKHVERRYVPKPGDKLFRPSRVKPWRIPLQVITKSPVGRGLSSASIIYGFAGIIIVGTILLILPLSSKAGQFTSPVNALFTATSAVCVTGLVVVDTGTYWSHFGQVVIMLLIQIGGFGFMTSATLLLLALRRRIGLRERLLIRDSMGTEHLGGLVRTVRRMAIFTILVEGAGALILFIHFLTYSPPETALWRAVFHSISAFNNAGLDIFGNFRSLLGYQTDATVLLTMAVLIILGGIGYLVVEDVFKTRSFDRLSLDSKLVLTTTFSLLALGTVFFLLAEFSNPATTGPLSLPHKLLVAFFQSVTPRTAGFTAIDVGKMVVPSLFFTMFLMFVGGASGSTAGGVKVGTLGLLSATVLSSLRGKEHAGAFGREFNFQNIQRGLVLVILYLGFAALLVLVLSITEGKDFVSLLFETFSALGTVGLSTGITPELSTAGRLIIVLGMFVGRLGPLALIVYLTGGQQPAKTHFPQELVRTG